jgi:hypothetical protein
LYCAGRLRLRWHRYLETTITATVINMYLGSHYSEVPETDPSFDFEPKQYGNNCEQRRFYLEDHIKGKKPLNCHLFWATDIRCIDGFYTNQIDQILEEKTLGLKNCGEMEKRWQNFKLSLGIGGGLAIGLGLLLVYKILD